MSRTYVFDAETHYRAQRRELAIEVARLKRELSKAYRTISDLRHRVEHGISRDAASYRRRVERVKRAATIVAGSARDDRGSQAGGKAGQPRSGPAASSKRQREARSSCRHGAATI
jgi:hypothetical protein